MQVLPVDLVLCMSDFYAQEARRYGAPKVERVYLGVDTAKFHPVRVAEDSDNVRVVCLARFKPRKGLDVLVRAAAIVLRENPRVDFTIAGSTSSASTNYAQELREMIDRLEVCDSVRIREDVTLDMVPDLLRSSHIAVQPSFGEGLGLAALEALSTGLPIVASRTTGLTEFIRDAENGLLVAPGDVAGLAAAITRLVTDQNLRAQLGAEGRRTVTEGFDSETMLKQTEALYEGLVRDRLPARQAPTP